MQIDINTTNLIVFGISWGLTPDDIYLCMLGHSNCTLFSKASHHQEMSHGASVHWSTPPPQPPWHSLTHIHTPVSVCQKQMGWGRGRICSASRGDLSLYSLSMQVIILTAHWNFWHLFIYLCYHLFYFFLFSTFSLDIIVQMCTLLSVRSCHFKSDSVTC